MVEEKKDISTGNLSRLWKPAREDILQIVSRANPHFSWEIVLTIVNQWDIISYHNVPYHIISYCIIFYRWDGIVKDFLEFTQTCEPPNISEKIRVSLYLVKLNRLQRFFSFLKLVLLRKRLLAQLSFNLPRGLSRAIHSQLNGSSRLLFETWRDLWQTEKLNIRFFVNCKLSRTGKLNWSGIAITIGSIAWHVSEIFEGSRCRLQISEVFRI